ncbi:hypothetical protein [Streptomyces sp. S1]|uniref:hypothetical protein n=1 Tax=Streptomyces sp. S1 TaxID=718288 RepID=UPI000EF7B755|nr:hypothetical protein [Streptomyces sp. S1]
MERSARRLAALVPALLCAIWSLLLTPPATADPATPRTAQASSIGAGATTPASPDRTPGARTAPVSPSPAPARTDPAAIPLLPDPTPAVRTAPASAPASPSPAPARTAPALPAPAVSPAPVPVHRFVPPEPHLAPAAVVGLPAVVEHSVRFPAAPATPAAVPVDLSLPPRGLLAGDPRRERAPPGGPHVPRDPRGPPSTRHR